MKLQAVLSAAMLSTAVSAGSITEGVRAAETASKDEYGVRFSSLVAGLLALRYDPTIAQSTTALEHLLPALSCDGVKLASDEFSWRERRQGLEDELIKAAAKFNVSEVYVTGAITLGDYDFNEQGFPFNGNHIEFTNIFSNGVPVLGPAGSQISFQKGSSTAMYNPSAAIRNGRRMSAYSVSPNCSLYVKNSGGKELRTELIGLPLLLEPKLLVSEADARKLVEKYPRREFVLLQQYTITGAERGQEQQKLFFRAENTRLSLCEFTSLRRDQKGEIRNIEPQCTKIIMPLKIQALSKPYPYVIGEVPSWARDNSASSSGVGGGGASGSSDGMTKTYTITGGDVIKGIGGLFGKAKAAISKPEEQPAPPSDAPAEAPKAEEK